MQHNASTRHTRFASLRYQACIKNAANNTAILQHNASTRHTRFASLRYQTCIKMHQNAAQNTAVLQHNASTRHTRFASLRYQTCIKNASKCSKKYSNNAAQCEPPTYPLCLPTLSKMHQNAARHPAQNTAGAQHNANPRQPRFASLRYQKYIKI